MLKLGAAPRAIKKRINAAGFASQCAVLQLGAAVGAVYRQILVCRSTAIVAEFVAFHILGAAFAAFSLRRRHRFRRSHTHVRGVDSIFRLDILLFVIHYALSFPFFTVRRMAAIYLAKIRSRARSAERATPP